MNARAWFEAALDEEAEALSAKSSDERHRHGRQAIDALIAAAGAAHSEALFKLGIYYQHGAFGLLPIRLELAEHWLRLSARRNPGGMLALGTLLMTLGRPAEGRRWLRKALSRGEGGAACHLARDVEMTAPARALRLYLKGAALGDPFAAVSAAKRLESRGSRDALRQAEALFKKAVRQEFPGAEQDLARIRHRLKAAKAQGPQVPLQRRLRSRS